MVQQLYNSQGLPKREGAEECQFFLKNGECKFSTTCKFNHPEYLYPSVDFNSKGFPLRPGQPDCDFYLKRRECKFGCTCSKNHPELELPATATRPMPANLKPAQPGIGMLRTPPAAAPMMARPKTFAVPHAVPVMNVAMNSLGLPIRPGAIECKFYMSTRQCKFGATCQFTHPEMGAESVPHQPVGDNEPATDFNSKGLPLRPGVDVCSFFSKTGECKFGGACKFDHNEDAIGMDAASELNSVGLPSRPGEQICAFYLKTGQCKFGQQCKFDHPEEYSKGGAGMTATTVAMAPPTMHIERPQAEVLTSQGLPSRPGQTECAFYMKVGQCKFAATCKFDHPEGMGGSQGGTATMVMAGGGPQIRPRAAPY